ncbi:hypothetical protein [Nonomuraea diastatica]|uniref:HNH endonuclease n=1 Tax=Nonomuraea diastatica TaxID=1848329 RepID=UPI001C70A9DA|nr:hypothetical protein [Nonomuraea diastatica]
MSGKENILFQVADAALASPDETVRQVVFPAVRGGEKTLRDLVHECKTKGPEYRRTVQTTLRASYTGHYRRGLIQLLTVLEFRSGNTAHQPVIRPLELLVPTPRKELIHRLRTRRCELCGQCGTVAVHQVAKLAHLGTPGPGQPAWAAFMARKRRKTLVVCQPCHEVIHATPVTHAA